MNDVPHNDQPEKPTVNRQRARELTESVFQCLKTAAMKVRREVTPVATATINHLTLVIRYIMRRLRLKFATHRNDSEKIRFGEALYVAGLGGESQRKQIADVDRDLKNSSTSLSLANWKLCRRRAQYCQWLAEATKDVESMPPGAESARHRLCAAEAAVTSAEQSVKDARVAINGITTEDNRRVLYDRA